MSAPDKKYDPIASILTSAYNLAEKFMEYQNIKKDEARAFAKKIDRLTLLAKKRETQPKRKKVSKDQTEEEKKRIADEQKEIAEFDELTIDTLTIVDGLLSSPAGLDKSFLIASTTYLRQKNSEKRKGLTTYFIQDVRDMFLVRLAQDIKIWDTELRQTLQRTMSVIQNVAMGFRRDMNESPAQKEIGKEIGKEDKEEDKASKYGAV